MENFARNLKKKSVRKMDKTDIMRERVKPVEVGDHVPFPLNILEHWQHKIMVGFAVESRVLPNKGGGGTTFRSCLQKISKKLLVPTVSPHS